MSGIEDVEKSDQETSETPKDKIKHEEQPNWSKEHNKKSNLQKIVQYNERRGVYYKQRTGDQKQKEKPNMTPVQQNIRKS